LKRTGAIQYENSPTRRRSGIEICAGQHSKARFSLLHPSSLRFRAILTTHQNRRQGLADGVVITPSHNPPEDGGFKYNPPHGGLASRSLPNIRARRVTRPLWGD